MRRGNVLFLIVSTICCTSQSATPPQTAALPTVVAAPNAVNVEIESVFLGTSGFTIRAGESYENGKVVPILKTAKPTKPEYAKWLVVDIRLKAASDAGEWLLRAGSFALLPKAQPQRTKTPAVALIEPLIEQGKNIWVAPPGVNPQQGQLFGSIVIAPGAAPGYYMYPEVLWKDVKSGAIMSVKLGFPISIPRDRELLLSFEPSSGN